MLVAKLLMAGRELQPVWHDVIGIGGRGRREQAHAGNESECDSLHWSLSIPFVLITPLLAGDIRKATKSFAAVPDALELTPAAMITKVCTSAGKTPASSAPFTGRISLTGRTARSDAPLRTLALTSSPDAAGFVLMASAMPSCLAVARKAMPLAPADANVIDFAASSVRLNASTLLTSGLCAPALIISPSPVRATFDFDETRPFAIRSSSSGGVRMATSNGAPPSMLVLCAPARPNTVVTLCFVAFSNCGASSSITALMPTDDNTLI